MTRKHMRFGNEPTREPMHYTLCGLDDVYLLSGYEWHETPHGRALAVRNLDGLHRVIGEHLTSDRKVLTGKEIRFLRKQMDLTQSQLATILGMSAQQVARWEKGQSETPGPADLLIRVLFKQHLGDDLSVRKLAEALADTEDRPGEGQVFEQVNDDWRRMAA